jgi:hypothetical protein
VPGADEVHLRLGEVQALGGLIGSQPFLDLGDGEAFAGRAALVQAEIAVGVVLTLMPEHADFVVADKPDAAIAILHFRRLRDELLSHVFLRLS